MRRASAVPSSSCAPARPRKTSASFGKGEADDLATLLKALGHPARLKLVKHLADHGTCYFGSLSDVLPLAPSTVSQHVTILKNAGLIEGSSDERRVCYCVRADRLERLKQLVAAL